MVLRVGGAGKKQPFAPFGQCEASHDQDHGQHLNHLLIGLHVSALFQRVKKRKAQLIKRPAELATSTALGEHVFQHGYYEIKRRLALTNESIELLVLLFANAPTITAGLIDTGIEMLLEDPSLDSAVTTSVYNMWSPLRARRLDENGCLQPFVPIESFGDPATLNCDRDSQGDVYFADMSVSIVRARCMEKLETGMLPQKWMGQRIVPIPSWGGCDVDYEWQMPIVEYWLLQHGFTLTADQVK